MADLLPLVRDVLDNQIYDANGHRMGKVDGIVVVLRQHRAPRVDAIELDVPALWDRLHPWLGRLAQRVLTWVSPKLSEPTRIRFEHVVKTGLDVHVDVDVTKTNAYVVEDWLKTHLIDHIPGGRRSGSKE